MPTSPRTLHCSIAALIALLAGWTGAASATDTEMAYTGRATVINATATVLTASTKLNIADTGELDPWGSTRDATVATVDNPPPTEIHSKTMHAITAGMGNVSSSTAAVEKLVIKRPSLTITADVVEANSFAYCDQPTRTVTWNGKSVITNLRINNLPVAYANKPNGKLSLPGGITVFFNTQTNPDVNTIAVTALRVTFAGAPGVVGSDVVVSYARSGFLTCI